MEKSMNYKGYDTFIDVKSMDGLRDGGTLRFECIFVSKKGKEVVDIRLDKNNEMFSINGDIITDFNLMEVLEESIQRYIRRQQSNLEIDRKRLERVQEGLKYVNQFKPAFYIFPTEEVSIYRFDAENNVYLPYTFTHIRGIDVHAVDEKFLKDNGFKPATYEQVKPDLIKLRQEVMEFIWPLK